MRPLVEEWRPVVGYEGRYEVSNHGDVKSLPRSIRARHGGKPDGYHLKGRILKKTIDSRGYYVVMLGKGNQKLVHRLVIEAFVPNVDNKPCCDHIDANRLNNRIDNLRWATYQENNSHPHAIANRSRPVLQLDKNTGEIIKRFSSVKEAQMALGTSYVSKCCRGKQNTTAGYKWKYEDESENY